MLRFPCLWVWKATQGRGVQAQFADLSQKEHVQQLHGMLREHILRRVKKDVLKQMPPKREQIVRVELSKQQKTFYKQILVKQFPTLSGRAGGGAAPLKNVMMELRKCCNHPVLFEEDGTAEAQPVDDLVAASGKLALLDRMLPLMRDQARLPPCTAPLHAATHAWASAPRQLYCSLQAFALRGSSWLRSNAISACVCRATGC